MAFTISDMFTPYRHSTDAEVNDTVEVANSYGTVQQADHYFMLRLDAAPWLDLEDITGGRTVEQQKEAALVSATRLLERVPFPYFGARAAEDQALSFPRSPPTVDDGDTPDVVAEYDALPDSFKYEEPTGDPPRAPVPNRVIAAQFEQALHLLSQEGILLADAQPGQIKLGDLAITNPGRVGVISPLAAELLIAYTPNVGQQSFAWGNDGVPLVSTSFSDFSISIVNKAYASASASARSG